MSVENKSVHRFELLMDAGFGAQKAGDILPIGESLLEKLTVFF